MLPIAAVAVILVTLLHEAAHAAAVLVQGGRVTEFVWMPEPERWGHIRFTFPHDEYSALAISMAPYGMWLAISGLAVLLSLRRRERPFVAASAIFIWLYTAPLADIAYAASGWLKGSRNDFHDAFGRPGAAYAALVVVLALTAAGLGCFVQRRLYGRSALSIRAYIVLAGTVLLALAF